MKLLMLCLCVLVVESEATFQFIHHMMNHFHCKLHLMFELRTMDAFIDSFVNQTGELCKTYCRVRRFNPDNTVSVKYYQLRAPFLSKCGALSFCIHGKCVPKVVEGVVNQTNWELIPTAAKESNIPITSVAPLTPTQEPITPIETMKSTNRKNREITMPPQ